MTNLKELKDITDTTLRDITVSEELKRKTLQGLHRKGFLGAKIVLAPALCAAALVIAVSAGVFHPGIKNPSNPDSASAGISTMAGSNDQANGVREDSTFLPGGQVLKSWNVEAMEDVKKYWEGAALTPSYIPQNYKLKEIIAAGITTSDVISIMMEFESEGRTFSITEDKGVTKKVNSGNGREVDISGVQALVDSVKFDNAGTTIYSTTVRWYKGDFMYAVQGSISEDEAIKVAKLLK